MSVDKQISLLIKYGRDNDGHQYSLVDVAKITGIRYQTLANLLKGSSSNPRLKTLRSLSQVYGISLDYFDCENEEACLNILKQHIVNRSHNVQVIDSETNDLSAKGKRNILAIMEWLRLASKDS